MQYPLLYIQELPDDKDNLDSDDESSNNSEGLHQIFYVNDVVCRFKSRYGKREAQFGIVCYPEVLKSNERLETVLNNGFKRRFTVFWLDCKEEEIISTKYRNIYLVERNFQKGMRVKRGNLIDGQVVGIHKMVTVKIMENNRIIANVPVEYLQPFHKAAVGDYVMKKEWIGVVTQVNYCANLVMTSDPDSECCYKWSVDASENFKKKSVSSTTNELKSKILFHGQTIQLSQSEILNRVEWITPTILGGKWRSVCSESFTRATVKNINAVLIVHWLYQVPTNFHDQTPIPPSELIDDFINLNDSLASQMQTQVCVGSLRKMKLKDDRSWDYYQDYQSWLQNFEKCVKNSWNSQVHSSLMIHCEPSLGLAHTEIISEDGEKPRKKVRVNSGESGEEPLSIGVSMWKSLGLAQDHDLLGKVFTVTIMEVKSCLTVWWSSMNHMEYHPSREFEPMLIDMSARIGQTKFCPGSVVTFSSRFPTQPQISQHYGVVLKHSCSAAEDQLNIRWFQKLTRNNDSPQLVGESTSLSNDVELHPLYHLGKGSIVIGHDLYSQGDLIVGIFEEMTDCGMYRVKLTNDRIEWKCWPDNVFKLPMTAFYDVKSRHWSGRNVDRRRPHLMSQPWMGQTHFPNKFLPSTEILGRGGTGFLKHLKTILTPCQFADSPVVKLNVAISVDSILNEISLLNGGRRPGIWIKTFVERMDILSVAMEGPNFTPYEDSLFFFTVKIPESFPSIPPEFYYHSYSPKILNPCLLLDGKVCLPLLNTYPDIFGCHQQEKWDPQETSIGLILMCIQKLILCSVPQDRKPSFGLWKLMSTRYCRQAYLCANLDYLDQIIQSVYNQLENPPKLWMDEMFEYYRYHIPKFYNRWMSRLNGQQTVQPYTDPPLPNLISVKRLQGLEQQLHHLITVYNEVYRLS